MTENEPLVSVGLPTYNRAASCRRAIESVLAQEYSNLELVISDNASTDGTAAMCREFAAHDPRIRYIRQPVNQGATKNFEIVLEEATGKYFMWLGDDDWIEENYVPRCVSLLEANPKSGLVVGKTVFHSFDGLSEEDGKIINYCQSSSSRRIISYYQTVVLNECYYGIMRREYALKTRATLKRNVIGCDWHVCSVLLLLGEAGVTEATAIHRTLGGTSANGENLTRSLGVHPFQAKNFWLSVAWLASQDIIAGNPAYKSLSLLSRGCLGLRVFYTVMRRHYFRHVIFPKLVYVVRKILPASCYHKLRNINQK